MYNLFWNFTRVMKISHTCNCHFDDKDENGNEVDLNWEWIWQTSDKWTGFWYILNFWPFKYLKRGWIEWFSVLANGDAFWKLAPGKWTLFGIDDVDNADDDDDHDHHKDNDVGNGYDDDDDQDEILSSKIFINHVIIFSSSSSSSSLSANHSNSLHLAII